MKSIAVASMVRFSCFFFIATLPISSTNAKLVFSIHQQQQVYEQSIYGEPPQLAVWLEDLVTEEIRTVFVTLRTGTGVFEGRAEVPVALPAWIGAFRRETGRNDLPSPRNPLENVDAITRATPKTAEFSIWVEVPAGSKWQYYVEVNVAGDYTPAFPAFHPDGAQDGYGNGQPSIIYMGKITATPGMQSTPQLKGRTEQMYLSTEIIPDLTGVMNAKEVLSSITVVCL